MVQASSRGEALKILADQAVSRGQALQVVARLAMETKWETVDKSRLQEVLELPPGVLGERFAEFLQKHAVPRKIIARVGIITVPGVACFVPGMRFHRILGSSAKVHIGGIEKKFQEIYLEDITRSETDIPETPVGVYELLYHTRSIDVVEALEAQERHRSKLHTVWHLLEKQGRGGEGMLSLEKDNVFFINDLKGKGHACVFCWNRVQGWWEISTVPMESSYRWPKSSRFFCPDLGL